MGNFTAGRVALFKCKTGKKQSIFWDGKTPGLGLRVTAAGAKSYVFETSLNGKTMRITIGDAATYTIAAAQAEATDYKAQTDKGIDPRQAAADLVAANIAKTTAKETAQAAQRQQEAIERAKRDLTARAAWDSRLVKHLTVDELQAILDAPIPTNRCGIRDRAMLHLCFAGALRVSELTGLRTCDLTLQPHASVIVHGKGRRQRCLPLWKETASAVRAWLAVRGDVLTPELFLNARGEQMTRSGFEYILRKHVKTAAGRCPSLTSKRVSAQA
ncbi:MAG: integrase family protein [Oxalobacteraceae bacterium]|nr:integrase family protein [Oxalobacteraceae bacterium]